MASYRFWIDVPRKLLSRSVTFTASVITVHFKLPNIVLAYSQICLTSNSCLLALSHTGRVHARTGHDRRNPHGRDWTDIQ